MLRAFALHQSGMNLDRCFSRARKETNQTLIYHNYFYPTKTGLCLPLKHTLVTPLNHVRYVLFSQPLIRQQRQLWLL